jgi:segregation and condensation protein B
MPGADIKLKAIIDALLFVADTPLSVKQLKQVVDTDEPEIIDCLTALESEYENREGGIQLTKVAGGYQLCTRAAAAPWIKRLYNFRQLRRLSQPAMETLSIIAYRQPLIRAEIEAIRGVDASGIIKTLLEKSLIKIVGRKKVPGRPIMYGTTQEFLLHFGLEDLSCLPKLEELKDLLSQDEPAGEVSCPAEDTNKDQNLPA